VNRATFTLALALCAASRVAGAQRSHHVSAAGPIRSIAEAVAVARPGDSVIVHAGVYREPTVVVDKRLVIVGEGNPVLDGGGKHGLIAITADDVTVWGFVLRNVGTSFVEDRAAIRVSHARGCDIENNRVENGFFGIYLADVTDCRIANNVLHATATRETEAGNGIHLWTSRRITITGNEISGHRDGIYFEFVHDSDVRGNTSTRNLRYGLHFMYSDGCRYVENTFRHNGSGVAVMYTKGVEMVGNRFEDNRGAAAYGLLLKEISDARLEHNVFARNTIGLLADGANRIAATRNDFIENGWAVRLDASTVEGRFARNNFAGNSFDVAGNYWDESRGYTLDRDGVGDVPFRPVRLFSVIVAQRPPTLILMRSTFTTLLDIAERVLPSLTPETLSDATPAMRWLR
jgi:nitrous oxidase accessory protein